MSGKHLLPIAFALFLVSCNTTDKKVSLINEKYISDFEKWKVEKRESRNHYLKLAGLFKLEEGEQTFGSGTNNNIVFEINDMPERLGTFRVKGDSIIYLSAETGSDHIPELIQFDVNRNSQLMEYDRWSWRVIIRGGDGYYLRLWDDQHPAVQEFKGYERYDLNPDLICDGHFSYYLSSTMETVFSKLGVNEQTELIGKVTFTFQDQEYSLDVGQIGFTMVNDVTTGTETYGGGRYMYLKLPEKDGPVTVDFNYLYNPPCSFSEYTTCLMPPQQNTLPFEIFAGEKLIRY